jgi:hypothetical protein
MAVAFEAYPLGSQRGQLHRQGLTASLQPKNELARVRSRGEDEAVPHFRIKL